MQAIELPRSLEDYFAHSELPGTDDARRFIITLPYFDNGLLERLQWWWSLPASQERFHGDSAFTTARREAIGRFSRHVERWLCNNRKRLSGEGPIPQLGQLEPPAADSAADADPAVTIQVA